MQLFKNVKQQKERQGYPMWTLTFAKDLYTKNLNPCICLLLMLYCVEINGSQLIIVHV